MFRHGDNLVLCKHYERKIIAKPVAKPVAKSAVHSMFFTFSLSSPSLSSPHSSPLTSPPHLPCTIILCTSLEHWSFNRCITSFAFLGIASVSSTFGRTQDSQILHIVGKLFSLANSPDGLKRMYALNCRYVICESAAPTWNSLLRGFCSTFHDDNPLTGFLFLR